MKFKAIDLFCGAGGLSTGLKKSGFRLCLGVDIDEKALKTYKCNLKRTKVLKEDIKKVTGEKITELTGINRRDNFLLAGCPPCQGFSSLGKRDANDEKNELVYEYIRIINELEPSFILMENVPGMSTGVGKEIFKNVVKELEENYHVEIDNYAMVDFNAMIDVVDALGGVDLEIDEDERVTANDYITCMCEDNGDDPEDYYIEKAGLVHLNGYQAVGYARNRYTGKGSDFGRTQRQRNVLTAIAEKAQDGDYASLSDTMEDVMPYITHDITEMQMIGLMMQFGSWLDYDIQQQHIPYDGEYTSQDEILVPTDMNATVEKLTSILYGDGEIETETESESETETEAVQ